MRSRPSSRSIPSLARRGSPAHARRAARALLAGAALAGCSSEPPPCGTAEAPAIFEVVDLSPPLDATVANAAIVHSFTIAAAPGVFQSFGFDYGPAHDAGLPVGGSMHFTITAHVGSVDYAADAFAWSQAPAVVEMSVPERFDAPDGCVFSFPSPLFRYAVTAP